MRGKVKVREGVVVSNKMDKTVVVVVQRLVKHPQYKKYVKRRAKYKRDEHAAWRPRLIAETRPLSKDKRWRVRSIVEKGN
jgi:small subunit ribosomal protein S17